MVLLSKIDQGGINLLKIAHSRKNIQLTCLRNLRETGSLLQVDSRICPGV